MAVPNNSATHSANRRNHGLRDRTASKRIPSNIGRSTGILKKQINEIIDICFF
jgi:hypothetical protein